MIRTVIAIAAAATLAACSSPDSGSQTGVQVVAANYPAEFLVEQVGGDLVSTTTLTAAGADPHDVELTPQQVGEIQDADALFYISEFQPAVDEAAQQTETAVDLASGITLREGDDHADEGDEHAGEEHATDPHIWLDPELMVQMAGTVADSLSAADPANAEQFQANAEQLQAELGELNKQFQKGTENCEIRTMVVSHEAFGYLADRYGFDQKGISGLSPETEPSASAIAELVDFVRDNGVTTVYTEVAVDPAVAQTIADEAGAATATLDPLGAAPADGDYLTAMRANLETLRAGQSCT